MTYYVRAFNPPDNEPLAYIGGGCNCPALMANWAANNYDNLQEFECLAKAKLAYNEVFCRGGENVIVRLRQDFRNIAFTCRHSERRGLNACLLVRNRNRHGGTSF